MSTEFLSAAANHIVGSFRGVLTNGFDQPPDHPISLSHFLLYTQFKDGRDLSNFDQYGLEDSSTTRLKCLALIVATPIVHAISIVLSLANRIVKLVLFAHFWYPSQEQYCFSQRAWSFGRDLLQVAFLPIIYVGLEVSAVYGLILPNNGRKLYATFERCAFGRGFLAPCFQPDPKYHLGGSPLDQMNGW
jgi:hypothetical protein